MLVMRTMCDSITWCVQLDPWKLEADDTKLLDLLPFLEAVVSTQVPDVRKVVASYEGQDIATAFKYAPSHLMNLFLPQ